jgi:hypothetical protein
MLKGLYDTGRSRKLLYLKNNTNYKYYCIISMFPVHSLGVHLDQLELVNSYGAGLPMFYTSQKPQNIVKTPKHSKNTKVY